ncbi:MAG: GGDEF domain-containing protein [Eubacteriales bacterium]|nr:GGDEF domain-containing protein [Eubacteriales bacterium]
MKRRIALFANGWGCEYLREVAAGVVEEAKEENCDVFSFVNFSILSGDLEHNHGEFNIFRLPQMKDFDGAILLTNSFNMEEERAYLHEKVMEAGIPAISVGGDLEGIVSLNTDNYYGMYELASHVIRDHGARKIVYLGGPKEHDENQIRLKAVKDVAEEMGFSIPEDNILYGDWARTKSKILIADWIEQHKELPDAIICANDVSAIGVCDLLKKHGYMIPEDIIVTGYDCTKMGQEYQPAISSVSHEWYRMGIQAMKLLAEEMRGHEVVSPTPTKTRFVRGGSCGCVFSRYEAQAQIEIGKSHNHEIIQGSLCDSHFRHIYLTISECKDADNLHRNLTRLLAKEHWMEGDDFLLCVEPDLFRVDDDNLLCKEGYSWEMDAVCVVQKENVRPHQRLNVKDSLFMFSEGRQEPQHYIVVPLCNREQVYGFAVLNRRIDLVLDNYLYSWTRHMDMYIDQMRRNIKLAELTRRLQVSSVTDVLTGVYNRAGCEEIAYPMLKEYHKAGKNGVVMIVDIDHMKQINDSYGHANGDLAVKTVATVLKNEVPRGWVVSRFGGDEFLVGGLVTDSIQMDDMAIAITERLKREVERQHISFKLTISIGYKVIDPNEEFNIEKHLKEADASMYFVKKCHHEEMEHV